MMADMDRIVAKHVDTVQRERVIIQVELVLVDVKRDI